MASLTPFMSIALIATIWSKVGQKITGQFIASLVDDGGKSFADFVVHAVWKVFDLLFGVIWSQPMWTGGFLVVVWHVGSHMEVYKKVNI